MPNLFDRIRAKTQQVVQGVGNFIDRDKSMGGVQLAQGGLGNRISQMASSVANRPVNVPRPVQNVLQRTNQVKMPSMNPLSPLIGSSRNLSNDPNYRSLVDRPQTVEADPFTNFMANRIGRPLLEIPDRITEAADPNRGTLDRVLSGAQAVGGVIPGLEDFFIAGAEGLKEQAAGNDPNNVLKADYQPTPLGDVLRNNLLEGNNSLEADLLDVVELPLMLGGMVMTGKVGDDFLKRADDIPLRKLDDFLEQTGQAHLPKYIDELNTEIKELNTSIRNHDLIAKVDPKLPSVAELQSILKQKVQELKQATKELTRAESAFKADPKPTMIASDKGVIPLKRPLETQGDVRQIDEFLASQPAPQSTLDEILQLPSPKETLGLPAPQRSVTIAQLKKLAAQGDNLEGVEFVAKNADEAREAIKLGLPGNQIKFKDKTKDALKELFSSPAGISKTQDPTKEILLETAKQEGGLVTGGNFISRATEETKRLLRNNLPDNLYKAADDALFTPLSVRNRQAEEFVSRYVSELANLGNKFKKGSKYSELTQKFGEGKITKQALENKIGKEGAAQIERADQVFRDLYTKALDEVNQLRKADGLEPIKYRKDYYRHMSEGGGLLDSIMSGTASQQRSLSIQKTRKGDKTKYDAVGGFLNYMEAAKRAGFTDKVAFDAQDFAEQLSKSGANSKMVDSIEKWSKRILGEQDDAGLLAGLLEKPANAMKKSQVVGNVSTLVNQTMGLPQAIWDAGPINFIKGQLDRSISSAVKQSDYLKVRGSHLPSQLFKGMDWIDAKAGRTLQVADQAAATAMWRGFYTKAKSLGVDDAVKWADDSVEATLGSRAIGGGGEWLNSPLGKLLTPFVSEPTAQANRLFEMMGEKRYGALLGITVTNFLVNQAAEKAYGQKPLPSPIDTAIDSYRLATGDDKTEKNVLQAGARIFTGMLEFNPVAQSIFANAYSGAEMLGAPDSRDIFGSEDPTRLNVGNLYNPLSNVLSTDYEGNTTLSPKKLTGNKPLDAILNFGSEFVSGGNQFAKTASGLNALLSGDVESRGGKTMFEAPTDPISIAQTLAFGPYSTSAAREYFDNDFIRPLSEKETATYESLKKQSPDKASAYLKSVQESKVKTNKAKGSSGGGFLENLFGGKQEDFSLGSGFTVETAEDKKNHKAYVDSQIEAGLVPESSDLKQAYFDNKVATSKSLQERGDVYKALKKAMDNEFLTDEQKQAILAASGASAEDYQYYSDASKDIDVKLQEIIPKLDRMSDEDMMAYLASGRKEIADKQMVTSDMITYLYDRGYISKEQQKFLNAIKYDQINDEFYASRGYAKDGSGSGGSGGSGGKRLTVKQAAALFKVKMGKLPTQPPSIPLSSTSSSSDSNSRLIDEILFSGKTKPNKNSSLWFE